MSNTLKRIMNQYRGSPKLLGLIEALSGVPGDAVTDAARGLYGRLDIDNSVGIQLDRIGYIVGQERPDAVVFYGDDLPGRFKFKAIDTPNNAENGFSSLFELSDGGEENPENQFTFGAIGLLNNTEKGFAGAGDNTTGGHFVGFIPRKNFINGAFIGLVAGAKLSDPEYRLLLKAIIFSNVSGGTIPELERFLKLAFGAPSNVLNGFTFIDIQFPKPLLQAEQVIIKKTLKPAAGIRVRNFSYATGPDAFGFDGGNSGFGSVGQIQEGSGFCKLFEI